MRTLFENHTQRTGKRTLLVSAAVHGLVLAVLVVVPLISYAALPDTDLLTQLILPPESDLPPPPTPPSPPRQNTTQPPKEVVPVPRLVIPERIPDNLPPPTDPEPQSVVGRLSENSGPTGVPGGAIGRNLGVPGGVIKPALREPPRPKPPKPQPKQEPVRLTSELVLSKVIRKVYPEYPPLAKKVRLEGAVHVEVTIDEAGNVTDVRVVKGHVLLNEAAVNAVRQWKFSPTVLNGKTVPVKAVIMLLFKLS